MPKGVYKRKPFSKKHKKNIGLAKCGIKLSEKTIKKMSETHKGKKYSKETKEKMSLSKLGNKNSLGRKHSKKTRRKMSKANMGNKNGNWKNGITPENMKIRSGIEYRLWRETVFARDSFICQKYGTIGKILRAHHIKNFAQYPELRFDIDNGITLSKKAHKEFHKIYGKRNNTIKQLKKFLNN